MYFPDFSKKRLKSKDSTVFVEEEETESKSEVKKNVQAAETADLVPKVASPAPVQSEWDYFDGKQGSMTKV